MAGMGQLGELSPAMPIITIEPEIGLKNLAIAVGANGGDDHGVAVRRDLDGGEVDIVEEFVERDLGLGGLGRCNGRRILRGGRHADCWRTQKAGPSLRSALASLGSGRRILEG